MINANAFYLKMVHIVLTITLFFLVLPGKVLAQYSCDLHIATFNIHYIMPNDKNDDWEKRKHAVTRVLQDIDADIVAFQEMETFEGGHYNNRNLQLDWIHSTTTGYKIAATGDPAVFPSTQPIIYKSNKYILLDQGFFFFSKTPDKIYSRQWNGGYPYFCSWVKFRSKCRDKEFYLFNVHNDFKSRSNRLKTSELIADRINKVVQEATPIIVLGDFNALKGFEEFRLFELNGFSVLPPGGATIRILGMHLLPAIDHILISKEFRPQSDIKVWRNRYDGVYPADHYPISVRLAF